jgi:hypothetical protein
LRFGKKPIRKKTGLKYLTGFCFALVPTARLELARLTPLPPQDSVSTNFTTSANANFLNKLQKFKLKFDENPILENFKNFLNP